MTAADYGKTAAEVRLRVEEANSRLAEAAWQYSLLLAKQQLQILKAMSRPRKRVECRVVESKALPVRE